MDKKVYNLKESSLGKINFLDGTAFVMIQGVGDNGQVFREITVVRSAEDGIKVLPQRAAEVCYAHIGDVMKTHNALIAWLIENWLEHGISTLKEEMYRDFGFEEFKNMDPITFIKSEPEMVTLTLVHIALKYTNGYLKTPVNDIEVSLRCIRNAISINFWEEGNPKTEISQM